MSIGPLVNGSAILLGGLAGAHWGRLFPQRLHVSMPLAFGCASMGLGIAMIVKAQQIPVIVLALLAGTLLGELCRLEDRLHTLVRWLHGLFHEPDESGKQDTFTGQFVGVAVLFCASGTGIFGALHEGMTGDASVLFTKAGLDLLTAGIFAISLGYSVAMLAIPQTLIQLALLLSARWITPLASPAMLADFTACGGLIMLATGLRISGIKAFPVASMLPALLIVMPLSALWMSMM